MFSPPPCFLFFGVLASSRTRVLMFEFLLSRPPIPRLCPHSLPRYLPFSLGVSFVLQLRHTFSPVSLHRLFRGLLFYVRALTSFLPKWSLGTSVGVRARMSVSRFDRTSTLFFTFVRVVSSILPIRGACFFVVSLFLFAVKLVEALRCARDCCNAFFFLWPFAFLFFFSLRLSVRDVIAVAVLLLRDVRRGGESNEYKWKVGASACVLSPSFSFSTYIFLSLAAFLTIRMIIRASALLLDTLTSFSGLISLISTRTCVCACLANDPSSGLVSLSLFAYFSLIRIRCPRAVPLKYGTACAMSSTPKAGSPNFGACLRLPCWRRSPCPRVRVLVLVR